MPLEVLLSEVAAAGLSLTRQGDGVYLPVNAPDHLHDALRQHQGQMLAILGQAPAQPTPTPPEADNAMDEGELERLAIQAESCRHWTAADIDEIGRYGAFLFPLPEELAIANGF